MPDQLLKIKFVKIKGYSLLNIRLVWYSLAFVLLVVTAVVTLNIDVTGDEDPLVRAYSRIRWKLITCLFNTLRHVADVRLMKSVYYALAQSLLIYCITSWGGAPKFTIVQLERAQRAILKIVALAYLPLCLYCDWCEKRGEEPPHVEPLRVLRDVVMTSFLMPITTFADVSFWMLFKSHAHIIAPPRVFEYVPYWAQHSLHTISMVTVIVDLLLTPRRRPDSMKPRLVLMLGLASAYCIMVHVDLLRGKAVYAFLSTASNTLLVAVYISFHVVLTIFYYAQWHLIDYIWGQKRMRKKLVKKR